MNPPTGIDLDPDLVRKIEDLLSDTYNPADKQEEAQLRELAFWRWVAYEGYAGRPPLEFVELQREFMLDCFSKTGWKNEFGSEDRIFELGCGPLGMIEFLPAKARYAFDPLNAFYSKLFKNLRAADINYIDSKEAIDSIHPVDLGICFNVLDHTDDANFWFDLFFEKIKVGGRFILQINTVQEAFQRTEAHTKMHPSPMSYEQIMEQLKTVSSDFDTEYSDQPSEDNEFFFMAWGVRNS
jgi:hypothetical protein